MSEKRSVENNRAGNSSENTKEDISEVRTLTHKMINGQLRGVSLPHWYVS